jgi:hypothetical protein
MGLVWFGTYNQYFWDNHHPDLMVHHPFPPLEKRIRKKRIRKKRIRKKKQPQIKSHRPRAALVAMVSSGVH